MVLGGGGDEEDTPVREEDRQGDPEGTSEGGPRFDSKVSPKSRSERLYLVDMSTMSCNECSFE